MYRMKSALCGSTLPWAIRAAEKPRKALYHGVFIAEVISALPLFQPPPPSLSGDQVRGFRGQSLRCRRSSRCPPSATQPSSGCLFGDSLV